MIRYCPRCGLRRGNINDGTLGKAERIKQLNILFAEAGSGEHAWGKEKEEEISIDKSPPVILDNQYYEDKAAILKDLAELEEMLKRWDIAASTWFHRKG